MSAAVRTVDTKPRGIVFTLVFTRRYCMGHRLRRSERKCAIPHGHNEVVRVSLQGPETKRLDGASNDLAPFGAAKGRWHAWIDGQVDHALQLDEADPLIGYFRQHEPEMLDRIMTFPGDPTTELLAACFAAKANAILADEGLGLTCSRVEIEETPTNTVVFEGDPANVLPVVGGRDAWWARPDDSINDLRPACRPTMRLA
jgi:6-pyruvoyltetrahydropterin/6-carboxytetrahydropterin synthase